MPEVYDEVAVELATWIIKNVPFPKLSGLEIAAMVDYHAVRRQTISRGAEFVCDMLEGQYSLDAILQAHKRYGRTSSGIRDEARRIRLQLEADRKIDDSELTEEERLWLEQHIQKFKRLVELEKEYGVAKKDICG